MQLGGREWTWIQKKVSLKETLSNGIYGDHSLRTMWCPFIDQGALSRTLGLSSWRENVAKTVLNARCLKLTVGCDCQAKDKTKVRVWVLMRWVDRIWRRRVGGHRKGVRGVMEVKSGRFWNQQGWVWRVCHEEGVNANRRKRKEEKGKRQTRKERWEL